MNVIPAFAPPTWMAISLAVLNFPAASTVAIALTAAFAATCGRVVLARLAFLVLRLRFLSQETRANIDVLRQKLEHHRGATIGITLLYAFTPIPSNYLFIAYGLSGMPLARIALPFFVGRCVIYVGWVYATAAALRRLDLEHFALGNYFGAYFIVMQCILLMLLWLFLRTDWKLLLTERKFALVRRTPPKLP